ncbi:MAG: hypothetical protein OXQ31_03755 [Spirochaetaceae bacterium]|nr:hypothetical protein [Spirochaetaceae bacterium]
MSIKLTIKNRRTSDGLKIVCDRQPSNHIVPFISSLSAGLFVTLFAVLLADIVLIPRPINGLWSCNLNIQASSDTSRLGTHYADRILLSIVGGVGGEVSGSWQGSWKSHYNERKIDAIHGTFLGYSERRLLFGRWRNHVSLHLSTDPLSVSYTINMQFAKRREIGKYLDGRYTAIIIEGYELGTIDCYMESKPFLLYYDYRSEQIDPTQEDFIQHALKGLFNERNFRDEQQGM